MSLTLTIPAPCDWLNSNQRLHWAVRAERTRAWRTAAFAVAHNQLGGYRFTGRAYITVTVHKTRGGRWDASNLAPTGKALIDGLVDSGLLEDDDNTRVVGPDMRAGEKRAEPCVVVRVEAIP